MLKSGGVLFSGSLLTFTRQLAASASNAYIDVAGAFFRVAVVSTNPPEPFVNDLRGYALNARRTLRPAAMDRDDIQIAKNALMVARHRILRRIVEIHRVGAY